jgi:hypothetical protein
MDNVFISLYRGKMCIQRKKFTIFLIEYTLVCKTYIQIRLTQLKNLKKFDFGPILYYDSISKANNFKKSLGKSVYYNLIDNYVV